MRTLNGGAKKRCDRSGKCDCGTAHGLTGLQDEGRILVLVTPAVFTLPPLALAPFAHA
jgi:hypothetical protein